MILLIRRALASQFLRHNAIFFAGSMLVAFLNYLYYPVVGRLLSPADFGEVQAIISLFLQASVFIQVLGLVMLGIFRRYPEGRARAQLAGELEWLALLIGGGLLGIVALASPALQSFLQFQSIIPFLLFAFAVFLGIPLAVSNSYLQGAHRFGQLAWTNIVGAGAKLLASAALVLSGLRASGAILGLLIAQAANLAYTSRLAHHAGRPPLRLQARWPSLAVIRPELRYAGLVLAVSLCINTLLSLDIIVVKHYFSPTEAGFYAGIATVARIIFFAAAPLAAVLIASVKHGQSAHNHQLFVRSLGLLALVGGGCLAVFVLAPQAVIQLLIGGRYLVFASQLPRLGLAIFLLSLANLLLYYQMALRQGVSAVAAIGGLIVMCVLLFWQHQSIALVVNSLIEGSVCLLILISVANVWPRLFPTQRRIDQSPPNR